jgi:hypothetical protein
MSNQKDIQVLRKLVEEYNKVCHDDIQDQRRKLWSAHHSLKETPTLIYVREGVALDEIIRPEDAECSDPMFRAHEIWIKKLLYRAAVGDDYVFEPWLTLVASHKVTGWGLEVETNYSNEAGGAYKHISPLKELDDFKKMIVPDHVIDEEQTERNFNKLNDAVGDLIEIHVDRGPAYRMWSGDIATNLGALRGIETVMLDMMDNPEWLKEVAQFMSDGILRTHEQAEKAGDWSLAEHYNQAIPYADELKWPKANSRPAKREELWGFFAAQELTLISPEMHDEFMLQYQIPIMEKFGLTAYGCCEDLTNKIDILRQVKNLRRISVAPSANVRKCAEQIGTDYVMSWRPNPAEMVCCGFDPDHIKKVVKEAVDACKGCHMDITLKDVQTVENDPERLKKWVDVVRSVL